jgi:hypothetical protein
LRSGASILPPKDVAGAGADTAMHGEHMAAAPSSAEVPRDTGKVAQVLSAAPASIAQNAAVMDWPAKEGEKPQQLRAGSNGWT